MKVSSCYLTQVKNQFIQRNKGKEALVKMGANTFIIICLMENIYSITTGLVE